MPGYMLLITASDMQQLGEEPETIASSDTIFIIDTSVSIYFYYGEVQGKFWEVAEGKTEQPHL